METIGVLIFPCFNGERYLQLSECRKWVEDEPQWRLLFVDNNSEDGTYSKLISFSESLPKGQVHVVSLDTQESQGEVVRRGVHWAIQAYPEAQYLGYFETNLTTPLKEIRRMVQQALKTDTDGILGVRKKMGSNYSCGIFRISSAFKSVFSISFLFEPLFNREVLGRARELSLQFTEAILEPLPRSHYPITIQKIFKLVSAWFRFIYFQNQKKIYAFCQSLIGLLTLGFGVEFIYYFLNAFGSGFDLTPSESSTVYSIRGWVSGQYPLYQDYRLPPYGVTASTPLYHGVVAIVSSLFSADTQGIYLVGRWISLVACLVSLWMVACIYLELGGRRKFAFWVGLSPLSALVLRPLSFSVQTDLLAEALSLLGILTFFRIRKNLWLSALILVLSAWTKQSFYVAAMSIGIYLMFSRRWRDLVLFAGIYLGSLLILTLSADVVTGHFFWDNLRTAPFVQFASGLKIGETFLDAPVVAGALIVFFLFCLKTVFKKRGLCLLLLYCGLATFVGGNLTEPLFGWSILGGLGLAYSYEGRKTLPILFIMIGALSTLSMTQGRYSHLIDLMKKKAQTQSPVLGVYLESFRVQAAPIFFADSGTAMRLGKDPLVVDLEQARQLENRGWLDLKLLENRLQSGEIQSVVVGPRFFLGNEASKKIWPSKLRDIVLRHYSLEASIDETTIFRFNRE